MSCIRGGYQHSVMHALDCHPYLEPNKMNVVLSPDLLEGDIALHTQPAWRKHQSWKRSINTSVQFSQYEFHATKRTGLMKTFHCD